MRAEEDPRRFRLQRIAGRVERGGRPPGMRVVKKGDIPENDVLRDYAGTRHSRSHVVYNLRGGDVVLRGQGLDVKMRPMRPRESRR